MYGYIYLIVNKLDGKTYIGQHKSSKEWFEDKYMGSGKNIRRAKNKYRIENFEKFLIQYCNSKEEMNEMEIFWIAEYRKRGKAEYNILDGGQGGAWNKGKKMPIGFGDKISKYRKGKTQGHWKLSNETRTKMSQPKSIEHRMHISEAQKGAQRALGYKWSIEQKEKLKKSRGNSWKLVDGKRVWYYNGEK